MNVHNDLTHKWMIFSPSLPFFTQSSNSDTRHFSYFFSFSKSTTNNSDMYMDLLFGFYFYLTSKWIRYDLLLDVIEIEFDSFDETNKELRFFLFKIICLISSERKKKVTLCTVHCKPLQYVSKKKKKYWRDWWTCVRLRLVLPTLIL